MASDESVITYLLKENVLEETELSELVDSCDASGRSLISVLKNRDLIDQQQLTRVTAISNDIEFIDLTSDMIDQMAVRLIPFDMARQHNLIPVRIEKDTLFVAMSSPMNLSVRDAIAMKTGYKVVPLAATVEAIKHAAAFHFNVESVTKQDIVAMRLKDSAGEDIKIKKVHSAKTADAPIVRLVDSIITGAIDSRSSDIHIEPHEPEMRVRYRVDGILIDALSIPSSAHQEVISHIKILSEIDISERRVPQDGHICFEHNGKEYDLRVSTLPATGGEKIVLRILDTTSGLVGMEQIAGSDESYKRLSSLISNPYGMVLLTGPTGSGKTTTLYSMIQALNTVDRNIVTIEDPVEYRLNGITQIQVKPTIGMTFASGLKSILRQDPDVILVGEIRDFETAEIAVSAALTGHLVLSTLHTNDAVGTISRLVSLGIPAFHVASSLLGAVAQRLVRKICPNCKSSYTPSEEELENFTPQERQSGITLYKSDGCSKCRDLGYMGRQGVYEILNVTPEIRSLIVKGASDDQILATAMQQGMNTLRLEGLRQAFNGITSLDELLRVVDMRSQ
ncbi:MAG: type II/IV secretion system protein [Planctomycetes bacterium]|nr:type II/IV secretion system protein [Planctomycetota bacterium]